MVRRGQEEAGATYDSLTAMQRLATFTDSQGRVPAIAYANLAQQHIHEMFAQIEPDPWDKVPPRRFVYYKQQRE